MTRWGTTAVGDEVVFRTSIVVVVVVGRTPSSRHRRHDPVSIPRPPVAPLARVCTRGEYSDPACTGLVIRDVWWAG